MSQHPKDRYVFGLYRLDPGERRLTRDGVPVLLQPKAFDLLLALIEHQGCLMTKDELLRLIWPDSVVEEVNLANNVSILRKTLGEDGQQSIETVPRHGYRFVAPVMKEASEADVEIAAEPSPAVETPRTAAAPAPEVATTPVSIFRRKLRFRRLMLLIAVLCLILTGAAVLSLSDLRPGAAGSSTARSIAVLPFKTIGAHDRDELLELGMADALITKLSSTGRLIVRPTGRVRIYAGADQDPLAAGRELGVDLVLDCTMQRSGNRVRVTARLLRVADGTAEGVAELEASETDLFRIQDTVSRQVAESLDLKLSGEQSEILSRRGTRNTEAFRLYVEARFFRRRGTTEGLRLAIDSLTRAVELDPNYAAAYVALSAAWQESSEWHLPAAEAMPKAKEAAEKALRSDDRLPGAHRMMGWVNMTYDWDWPGAEHRFKRAIELEPTDASHHADYAWLLSSVLERHDEALAELHLAMQLDPERGGGSVYYHAHRYDEGIESMRRMAEIYPNKGAVLQWLGLLYEQKGMYREAIHAFQKARQHEDTVDFRAYLGHSYALSGDRENALRLLDELRTLSHQRYVSPFFIALLHIGLGENDRAFEWLEEAFRKRSYWLIGMKTDPRLDRLRSDPRFTDLMRRVGHIR